MTNDFYRQFEDRFRSSRTEIKDRLRAYQPFLDTLKASQTSPCALDVGCGRGEWLELLTQSGFDAFGVDLDAGMLEACQALGLNAKLADGLETIKNLPDESLCLVSGFHVAEHIAFDDLLALIQQAYRVLVPGGLLVLETPNPENLSVGTSSFYLDPTHTKPIPHALLAFATQYGGFEAHKVLRLNEPIGQQEIGQISLRDVITGVSPDYAVVAVKSPQPQFAEAYADLFNRNYGLALETLASQYDHASGDSISLPNLEQAVAALDDKLFSMQCQLNDVSNFGDRNNELIRRLTDKLFSMQCQLNDVSNFGDRNNELIRRLTLEIEQMRLESTLSHETQINLVTELELMRRSTSWKITRPLRMLGRLARFTREHGVRGLALPFVQYARANPDRQAKAAKWLERCGLKKLAQQVQSKESDS
jgi:SAM-dependent methyltransferase